MHETVTSGEDVDEGTELGDRHHAAVVHGAEFGLGRIDDGEDARFGIFHAPALHGTDGDDAHHAVVVDADVGAGLLLDGVDDLALGSDHFTDLVERDGDRRDLRSRLGHFGARCGDGRVHHVEDGETSFLGLIERGGQHVGGNAVDLGVELQRGDHVGGSSDLEVHVAERVLGTEDVGEARVLAFGVHETHGDTGHRSLDRHTGVHERQRRRAHRCHRGGTVRRHHFRDEAQRVGEIFLARHDRNEGSFGEDSVTDLATLGRTHAAGFTVGPRSHVVMVHVTLLVHRGQRIDHLVHARHGECGHVQDLGLTALEQTRTVSRRQHAHFGRHRTQIARTAAVDANALVDDALAHQLLGETAHRFFDFLVAAGERLALATELCDGLGGRCIGGGVAIGLLGDLDGVGDVGRHGGFDGGVDVVGVVEHGCVGQRRDRTLGADHRGDELTLQSDRLLDPLLGGLETTGEYGLVHLRCAAAVVLEGLLGATGFDHHDGDVAVVEFATGDHEFERALVTLGVGGVSNPGAILRVGHAHGTDRAVERNSRDHESGRCRVDAEHVVRVDLIGTEHGEHDLHFVAETVGEGRTQRTVGETTREDGVLGGATLTTEERSGDLAGRVGPLFHVDRQREEVDPGADVFGRVGRGEDDGVADGRDHGTLTLQGESAGLEGQALVGTGNGTRHSNGVSHDELLSGDELSSHQEQRDGSQSAVPRPRRRHGRLTTDPSLLGVCVAADGRRPPRTSQRRRPNSATISRYRSTLPAFT